MKEIKIKVEKEKRTNTLSKIDGGTTIFIKKRSSNTGRILILEYNNIKNVKAYIKHVKNNDPNFISYWIKGEEPEDDSNSETNTENKDINFDDDLPF